MNSMKQLLVFSLIFSLSFQGIAFAGKPTTLPNGDLVSTKSINAPDAPKGNEPVFPGPVTTNNTGQPLTTGFIGTSMATPALVAYNNHKPLSILAIESQVPDAVIDVLDEFRTEMNGAYAISDPDRVKELAGIIAVELDAGFLKPLRTMLREHGDRMDVWLGEFIGDLLKAENQGDVDNIQKLAHEGLTVEYTLIGEGLDDFAGYLKAMTKGSGTNLNDEIDELIGLFFDTYETKGDVYGALVDDIAHAARNDHNFWIPEIGDEVQILLTTTLGERYWEFFNKYRPQFSQGEKDNFDPVIARMVEDAQDKFFFSFFDVFTELSVVLAATGNETAMEELSLLITTPVEDYFMTVQKTFKDWVKDLGKASSAGLVDKSAEKAIEELMAASKQFWMDIDGMAYPDDLDPVVQKAAETSFKKIEDVIGEVTQIFADGFESGAMAYSSTLGITLQTDTGDILFRFFNNYRPQFSKEESDFFDGPAGTLIDQAGEAFDSFFDVWTEIGIIFDDTDGAERLRSDDQELAALLWEYELMVMDGFRPFIRSMIQQESRLGFQDSLKSFTEGFESTAKAFKVEINGFLDHLIARFGGKPPTGLEDAAKVMLERVDAINLTFLKGAQDMADSMTALNVIQNNESDIDFVFENLQSGFKGSDEELQAFIADLEALNDEYIGFVYEVFRDVRVTAGNAETPQDFANAVKAGDSQLLLGLQEWADKALVLVNGFVASDPDNGDAVIAAYSTIKGFMIEIEGVAAGWLNSNFRLTWAACVSPLCGGW